MYLTTYVLLIPKGRWFKFRFGLRAGNFSGLNLAGLDHLAKYRTELGVAIVQQVATVCQKAPILHRYVSRLLLNPLLVRIRRDPGQAHPVRSK